MNADRYLKIVLTIIAMELGVIALKDGATPAAAQQAGVGVDPLPVIVTGVAIDHGRETSLPVTLMGAERPIPIEAEEPLRIEAARPVVVQTADRPLMIKSFKPHQRCARASICRDHSAGAGREAVTGATGHQPPPDGPDHRLNGFVISTSLAGARRPVADSAHPPEDMSPNRTQKELTWPGQASVDELQTGRFRLLSSAGRRRDGFALCAPGR